MVTKIKTSKYAHLPLNQDVEASAGYYTPEKEVRMTFQGREVLYVTGHVVVETTCGLGNSCTPANYWYATVPGYIVNWQAGKNKKGLPVTEIESIIDIATQNTIRKVILKNEAVARVDFW
jgi:hypothetical protein